MYGPAMGMNVGMCFDRSLPAPFVVEVAETLEEAGVDQLWVIEDCFYTAGISLAATALARTEWLTVGLGIVPAVARNPAVTAMERSARSWARLPRARPMMSSLPTTIPARKMRLPSARR